MLYVMLRRGESPIDKLLGKYVYTVRALADLEGCA
jgi:hypothetical protein